MTIDNKMNWDNDRRVFDCENDKDGRKYDRDYCRILYSAAFRRLQGKMQLLGIDNTKFFRNRLTHSLEVSQIARSIALMVKDTDDKNVYDDRDIYVVESGALAHDIGNPPFGHSGERKLNKIFDDIGGFEGNAQSLRILTTLENKITGKPGLDLRYRTLLSIVKYYKQRECFNGKFVYDDDYHLLNDFLSREDVKGKVNVRTTDVQIVDIADEIAYAAHDLEDGLRNNCFTIDEIIVECRKSIEKYKEEHKDCDGEEISTLESTFGKFIDYINEIDVELKSENLHSAMYSMFFAQELISKLINKMIRDVDFGYVSKEFIKKTGTENTKEIKLNEFETFAEILKKVVFDCINNKNKIKLYEKKGDKVLEFLSDFYIKNPDLLSPEYRADIMMSIHKPNCKEKDYQKRLVCDYIAGMTEAFVIKNYEDITGKKFDSILG